MTKQLTSLQALRVASTFLDDYYQKTLSDDLGSLLGDISLLSDDTTADPAAWSDWNDALEKVLVIRQHISEQDAFLAMIRFLEEYTKRISSSEIDQLIDNLKITDDETNDVWKHWTDSIKLVLGDTNKYYGYLHLS